MSWGVFPLFFASFGLGVERIGVLKAVYPAVWGVLQDATGPLSDRWGRKGLIVGGMWVQAGALFVTVRPRVRSPTSASSPRGAQSLASERVRDYGVGVAD